jgi:hypothetical protein
MSFFKGDKVGDDREITEALLRLRKHLISEFSTAYTANVPKMVWKSRSTYQCLIRRTLEAVDGMRSAWNAGNLLTALTMGRSLIESGAVVRRLSDSVKEATAKKDVEALDHVVMNVGFGTRYELFEGEKEEYKAQNILTVIDRMDRSLFGDKTPRLRDAYDFLSEFVHPNHLGILGLYSDDFPKEFRIEFGRTARKKEKILPHLRISLGMILLVENAASDFESLIPAISEFVPK